MGKTAANFADLLIITSDNPRTENPVTIMDEIMTGVPPEAKCLCIADRREAIGAAIQGAGAGDVILIAGKGHEDSQEINGRKVHFDDREEVRHLLNA